MSKYYIKFHHHELFPSIFFLEREHWSSLFKVHLWSFVDHYDHNEYVDLRMIPINNSRTLAKILILTGYSR